MGFEGWEDTGGGFVEKMADISGPLWESPFWKSLLDEKEAFFASLSSDREDGRERS